MSEPLWAQIFIARWRRPKDFNPMAWEVVFTDDLGNWKKETMINVMKWMQSQGQDWGKFPTANTLTLAYRVYTRQHDKGLFDELHQPKTQKEIVDDCKTRIAQYVHDIRRDGDALNEENYGDIWDMMCAAEDAAGNEYEGVVRKLEDWAKRMPDIAFDRNKTAIWRKTQEWREKQHGTGPLSGLLGKAIA